MKTLLFIPLIICFNSAVFAQEIDTTIVITPKEALNYFMQESGPRPRSFISPITHKEVWVVDLHYINVVFTPIDTINRKQKRVIKKIK